jgi:hypothetical protein
MQITLVSSGDTVSAVLDNFVSLFCVNESELNSILDSQYLVLARSIYELKEIVGFLATKFNTTDLASPKRNSKISLAAWIVQVLSSAREAEASEVIADQVAGDFSSPEIEVLEPEEKRRVYLILIVANDCHLSKDRMRLERVTRLPPYLIDRNGNLLKKVWHRGYDAGYAEINSEHLSNIAIDSGLVIELMAENLEVSQACICGDPPPFILHKGAVYKRDHLKLSLAVRYAQVISEYLSNIVVV